MFSRPQRWLLLAAFALIVVLRLPDAWAHGPFQDEEATVFLAYAWHRPWFEALFRSFAGYWNLGANATTLLVVELVRIGVLPLERALSNDGDGARRTDAAGPVVARSSIAPP